MRAEVAFRIIAAIWLIALLNSGIHRETWAASIYWDGTGTSWSSAASWSTAASATTPDPAAPPGAGDIANFNITTVNTPQTVSLDVAQSALGLVFDSSGPVLIQSGSGSNTLWIGTSGILVNSGAGAESISSAVSLGGPQSWSNNSSGTLTVSGNIANASNLLTIAGSGNTVHSGILGSGSGGLTKNGPGMLTLNGANSYTGATTINAGTVILGNASALGTTASGTTVASGATLDLAGQTVGPEALTVAGTGVGGNGALENSSATPATFAGTITNQTFTVGGSGDINLAGSINGTSSLTKIGAGTLTLSGTTDNSGLSLAVNSGTVVLAKTSNHAPDVHAVGWDAPLFGMFVSGGTAQLGGTGGDQIYDSANVTVTSGAFDTNGRSETFSTLYLQGSGLGSAGALVNTNASVGSIITPSAGTVLTGDATIGVTAAASAITLNNAISGNFALTKVGPGTLTLGGSNTFTGGVTIGGGNLQLGNSGALNASSPNAVSFSSGSTGILSLNGSNVTVSSLTTNAVVGSPVVQNGGVGAATLTVNGGVASTYDGILQNGGAGALSLTKSGAALLRLSGNNTFSGGATLSAGTLSIANDSALGTGPLNITGGTISADGAAHVLSNTLTLGGDFTFGGLTSSDLTLSGPATLTGNRTITVGGPIIATLSGNIGQDVFGSRSLSKLGGGTLLLSGSNTFSGGVNLNDGALLVGNNAALGTGPLNIAATGLNQASIGASGGARVISNALTIGGPGNFFVIGPFDLTLTSPITLTRDLDIELMGTAITTLSGNIGQDSSSRSVEIAFPGTLRLSGNSTFSGGVFVILGATLLIGSNSALGSSNTVTVESGTLAADGTPRTIGVAYLYECTVDGSQDLQFTRWVPQGASASLTKNGTGTLTLGDGQPTISAAIIINSGTVRMANSPASPPTLTTVTVNSPGVWDLAEAANKVDNLVLSGGSVTMGTGSLQFNNATAVTTFASSQTAAISGSLSLNGLNGANTFDVADGPAAIDLDVSAKINADSLIKIGAGALRLSGANTFLTGVTVNAGTLLVASSSALGTGTLTINGGAVDLSTFASGVSHASLNAGSLSMTGNFTVGTGGLLGQSVAIDAPKSLTVSGTTTVDPSSSLTIDGGTLNTSALLGSGTFNFLGGTLGIAGAAGLTIGSGSLMGTNVLLGSGAHLNVTNSLHINGTGRLSNVGGNVLASNVLVDTGGRWTVSDGVQSVGTGLVNHGTLVLIDTTINGPVNSPAGSVVNVVGGVAFNQLVSGAGQFFGSGTATFNGGYSPGDSPATVSFQGGVTLGAANTLTIEIAGTTPGTGYDQLHVVGQLALGGTLHVSLIGAPPALGDHYDILDWGSLNGTFPVIQLPPLSGAAWDTSQLYTSGTLNILPVRGDINRDGHVDVADVSALMVALADLPTYQGTLTSTQLAEIADLTADGVVNNLDVQGLINQLANGGGSGSLAAVPEPAGIILLGFGGMVMIAVRRVRRSPRGRRLSGSEGEIAFATNGHRNDRASH